MTVNCAKVIEAAGFFIEKFTHYLKLLVLKSSYLRNYVKMKWFAV
jgi:hypothetical protein